MAHRDYSATPLGRKLGIREGSRVLLADAPEGFGEALEPLPAGAELLPRPASRLDVVLLFATRAARLAERFPRLARRLEPNGRLWVAWPKRTARLWTDLTFEDVQRIGLAEGLVDNKSASIDDAFQGIQFVVRLRDRPERPRSAGRRTSGP